MSGRVQLHIKEYIGVNSASGIDGVGSQGYSRFEVWRQSTENYGGWFEPWDKIMEVSGLDIDFPAIVKDRDSLWNSLILELNSRFPGASISYEKRHIVMVPKDRRIGDLRTVVSGILTDFDKASMSERHGVITREDGK